MTHSWGQVAALAAILAPALGAAPLAAQDFDAPRGDRTSGYRAQSRSEVLARNGMVATSQPVDAGGYQAIWLQRYPGVDPVPNGPVGGVYRGASDHRKDGEALGW